MSNVQEIKGFSKKIKLKLQEKPKNWFQKSLEFINWNFKEFIYWPIESFFTRNIERIGRSYSFARHGWLHYDFEGTYLYDIMAFKLRRVYLALKNGHGVHSKENLAAIRETIKICDRLFNEDHERKSLDAHYKRFPVPKRGSLDLNREFRKGERKSFEIARLEAEANRCADIDRLAENLKKHQPSWWD